MSDQYFYLKMPVVYFPPPAMRLSRCGTYAFNAVYTPSPIIQPPSGRYTVSILGLKFSIPAIDLVGFVRSISKDAPTFVRVNVSFSDKLVVAIDRSQTRPTTPTKAFPRLSR